MHEYNQTNSRKDILPRLIDKNGKLDLRIKLIITNLMALFLFWGGWVFSFHFAIDDYEVFYNTSVRADFCIYDVYRLFYGLFLHLLNHFQINIIKDQVIFGVLLIGIWAVCISAVTLELLTYLKDGSEKWLLVNLGSLLLFANVFVGEWFYFLHAYPSWLLAVVGAALGSIYISRGKKRLMIGLVFLILLAGSYQAGIPIYVFIVMSLIFIKNKGRICKNSLKQILSATVALVLSVGVNSVLVHIYRLYKGLGTSSRVGFSVQTMVSSLKQFIGFQKEIWVRCYGLLPNGVLLAFLIAFLGLLMCALKKERIKKNTVSFVIIVLLSGQITLYLIASVQTTFWNPVRVMVPLFGVFSCSIWLLAYLIDAENSQNGKTHHIVGVILCICLLLTNFIGTQKELTDVMVANSAEHLYADHIHQQIKKYESDTGCIITNVGFIRDKSVTWKFYPLLSTASYWGEMAEKAMVQEWCNIQTLNYYTSRNFVKIDPQQIPADIRQYVEGIDWTEENLDEQLIFRESNLFIALY